MIPEIQVLILSMTPISELRGAIPYGLTLGLPFWQVFLISFLGNLIPVVFLLLFLGRVSNFLSSKFKIFEKFFHWLFKRTHGRVRPKIEKYGKIGLLIFVALPLPVTGGWTGSIAAFLMGFPFEVAFPLIVSGIFIAGTLVSLASIGGFFLVEKYLNWQTLLVIVAISFLIYLIFKIRRNQNKPRAGAIILNKDKLNHFKVAVRDGGRENFFIISDFDRTLTRAFVLGQKSPTTIGQLRNGNYLTSDYISKAYALYDKYHPVEIDSRISREEKNIKMQEWWSAHFNLLIECGLTREVLEGVVKKKTLQFRGGALEFFDYLYKNSIPLIIMSAGPGDMIAEYLRQEGRFYDNIHIVANFFEFDGGGKIINVKEPIIHSLNKTNILLKDFPFFNKIKERKNVILLGDGPEDIGMIEGFDYENLLKVGFLNEEIGKDIKIFKKNFDVILPGDSDMKWINEFLGSFWVFPK